MTNVLLVYPEFPPSYWGFRYAVELLGKRAAMPPLGLLTVAAMFPSSYRLRLVDMNTAELGDDDIAWADLVLTSTMVAQRRSLREVVARCRRQDKSVVVGGPHPTSYLEEIPGAEHYLLGEVEESFPEFLADWEAGEARAVYRPATKPAITGSPTPRFDLLDLRAYSSMALQFSRGCPFDCEFCDITKLFGRTPRTKSNEQMLRELDCLYELDWRGPVFLVDDNFIGNKREALRLLPDVAAWQRSHGYPFDFFTEASVNLAQLPRLMEAMVEANFTMVFLGIESPNPEALRQTNKVQNTGRGDDGYLLHAVHTIQEQGLEVSGGFILGLDGDGPEVFDAQVAFIQEAGIPVAMVGLLSALRGTDLYQRLEREDRLLEESTGNNVEIALNFEPQLERTILIDGYRRVLATLYDPGLRNYFERCWTLFSRLRPRSRRLRKIGRSEILACLRSLRLQLLSRQAPAYLRFLLRTLRHRPDMLAEAVRLGIMGLHFERFTRQTLSAHDFRQEVINRFDRVEAMAMESVGSSTTRAIRRQARRARRHLAHLYRRLRPEFRRDLLSDWSWIQAALHELVHEVAALQLLHRIVPHVRQWFSGWTWLSNLRSEGYEPTEQWPESAGEHTLTIAPLLAQGKLRRSLERFFSELGVKVVTCSEQMARLGQDGVEHLLQATDGRERLVHYLHSLGQWADTVVVPLTSELGQAGERIQVLAAHAADTTAQLPQLVCVRCEQSRGRLRAGLVELGVALTGDPLRADAAFERAFALF